MMSAMEMIMNCNCYQLSLSFLIILNSMFFVVVFLVPAKSNTLRERSKLIHLKGD